MRKLLIILFSPFFLFSQNLMIKQLSDNINSVNSEINFIQINDSLAYYTGVIQEEKKLVSNIYSAKLYKGVWRKKLYSFCNYKFLNTANISFSEDDRIFFTVCNDVMKNCKIAFIDLKKNNYDINYVPIDNSNSVLNTQPFVTSHNGQSVLYFVSDRDGGFGGLDIWLSIIDNQGNFGIPINAGFRVNSTADEITPFFNKQKNMLYFSSNRTGGSGGFDIYSSEGRFNLWKKPDNILELNSPNDDLYLTFYDKNTGHFSSNRIGALTQTSNFCCNDIFYFTYHEEITDTSKVLSPYFKWLPLNLYFHNDSPDPRSMSHTTELTYKDAYIMYYMLKEEYEKKNPELNSFFEDVLQINFNDLNNLLDTILIDLQKGQSIQIKIRGYSSPLHNEEYNKNLSKRRISSFINYLKQFKNNSFINYLALNKLSIQELPLGEGFAPLAVSDDPKDQKKSIFANEAMLERKIEIVDVILKK